MRSNDSVVSGDRPLGADRMVRVEDGVPGAGVGPADRALALDLLAADPQWHRIDTARRDPMIDTAFAIGASTADHIRSRFGTHPDDIAAALGVPVEVSATPADYATTLVFATYSTRPPRIVLFRDAIARVDACIAAPEMRTRWGGVAARAVYVAHELFHHLDDDAVVRAPDHRVTLLAVGPWRRTAGVAAVAEIAAGAFAQHLLGLPEHPRALDLLAAGRALPQARERPAGPAVGSPSAAAVG